MYPGFLPKFFTIALAMSIYYLWTMVLHKNDTVGMALSIIAAIFVLGAFARLRRRK